MERDVQYLKTSTYLRLHNTVCLNVLHQQTANSHNKYITVAYICTVKVLGALLLLALLNPTYFTHITNQKHLGKHHACK